MFGPKTPHRRLMKNLRTKLLALFLTLAALFTALCGCADPAEPITGTATVVIGSEETTYAVNFEDAKLTTKSTAYDLLVYLNETEGLALEVDDSGYGKYLTKVGNIVNGVDNKYIYVFTSVEADFDTSGYEYTITYKGKTLTSSGVGIDQMHLQDGCIIYVGFIVWAS